MHRRIYVVTFFTISQIFMMNYACFGREEFEKLKMEKSIRNFFVKVYHMPLNIYLTIIKIIFYRYIILKYKVIGT